MGLFYLTQFYIDNYNYKQRIMSIIILLIIILRNVVFWQQANIRSGSHG